MKLLCDVHISYKIVKFFTSNNLEAIHVNDILDRWNTKDKDICDFADKNDYIVLTKDVDFRNSHFLKNTPKKLMKISLGNISTIALMSILTQNIHKIEKIAGNDSFLIEINSDTISYSIH
jgi:predicted nuclease of predicted toxin-antitoxin system